MRPAHLSRRTFSGRIFRQCIRLRTGGQSGETHAALRKNGVLTGTNAYEGTEFLTSTDERFRPVNLSSGPDGALYLVDMYHGILQHRIYMTSYLRKQVEERDLAAGNGLGRIYRIVRDGTPTMEAGVSLARETPDQLVRHLLAVNSWWRDTAQRILVEQKDISAVPALRQLARSP